MVGRLLVAVCLAVALEAGEVLERARAMMGEEAFGAHRRLVALLFENEGAFYARGVPDLLKIAETLRENNLLKLSTKGVGEAEVVLEYEGESPLFFLKLMGETLRNLGYGAMLTQEARYDGERFVWTVALGSNKAPDPVEIGKRLARRGVRIVKLEKIAPGRWNYGVDLREARPESLLLQPGEVRKIVRPVRPLWLDVSKIRSLTIRELPGSHWHADVVVYDKMLKILSLRQNDVRTRHMRLRLPTNAAYVKISDRFTLENLRSGLQLSARGSR